jgi:hypothetical protein
MLVLSCWVLLSSVPDSVEIIIDSHFLVLLKFDFLTLTWLQAATRHNLRGSKGCCMDDGVKIEEQTFEPQCPRKLGHRFHRMHLSGCFSITSVFFQRGFTSSCDNIFRPEYQQDPHSFRVYKLLQFRGNLL